jgi:hypothetical protein
MAMYRPLINQTIIITLIVWLIYACFWNKMIFGFIGNWLKSNTPEIIQKPLATCPMCMSIWWGSVAYWLIYHNSIKENLIVVFASGGLSAIIVYCFPSDE